jgi:hypothetical protein
MAPFLWGYKLVITPFLWGSHPISVGESPHFCGGVTPFLWGNMLIYHFKSISYDTRKLYKLYKKSNYCFFSSFLFLRVSLLGQRGA